MLQASLKKECEDITSVIYEWLTAEVASSSDPSDVNAVLNSHQEAVEGLRGGIEHKNNFAWNKHDSHMSRLDVDVAALKDISPEDPDFDRFAAKVTFDGLMEASGSYRIQCYIEASDQNDYMSRRLKVIGLNVGTVVQNRLIDLIPVDAGLTDAKISPVSLDQQKNKLIERDTTNIKRMISIMTLGEDRGRAVRYMVDSQYLYLMFVTDSIILSAKSKGGALAEVPILEPRSISEQSGQLHYPFRQPLDWAEIMAANPPLPRGKSSS